MDFKIKLDFCVIPSPYNKSLKTLVFLAYAGTNRINEKLCLEEDYVMVRYLLEQHGYQETDFCTFESSNNATTSVADLIYNLTEAGMHYSKHLEFTIMDELEIFHKDLLDRQSEEFVPAETNIFVPSVQPNLYIKPKAKIPKVGEKITMYFYLLLQCHFLNENDCILELIGDLYSKKNNNTRNYIHISKSDFVRLESSESNVILLQSTKTFSDLANEINFLHKGSFKFVKPIMSQGGDMIMKTKEFLYNIMEIKKNINPSHRIVVEINMNQYYDDVINASKRIKKEFAAQQKRVVSLESIRPEVVMLKQKLKEKMINLAEVEEFEKANVVKTDLTFIDNKLTFIDTLEEKIITQEEFSKTFCLNS